ncbi:GGDEF domain-containing protein [Jeotgalibacillus haloalkalitolerans]|uniref:Diguanylate cyclase n=1 Tax=Jeotgalibacillus haloalkalitolerans TaxID=3104292 RepID=A0ABU5KIB6_9BACL|nr:diguanylate cyclase [Jeotgalibacillus sp. HH7-29]MDZ5710989.1 diguanylate cyclase [Jeotgalibacillus sp. HH7-29]
MLDPITLGAVVFVLAIISAIVMTITWKMNIQERGLDMWAWAAIIGGLGFLPLLFVPIIGSYAAVLNNLATLLTPILILEGIMRFKGYHKERLRLLIFIMTFIYATSFILLFREMPNARFLVFDSLVTIIFFLSAFFLLWKSTGLERKIYMISAATFILIGSSFAGRWFLALNGAFEANFESHPYTSFLFFMVIIWTVGWTYGLSIAVNVRNHNRVMKLATHDYLTGLPNRKYLDSYIEQLLHSGTKKPFVLYSLDLNGFKQINDLFGHKTGDDVLVKMAESLRDFAWGQHTAVRLGGDEFVVIMQQSIDKQSISHTKKAIREAVENDKKIDAGTINLKTSIGYAAYPIDGQTMDELLIKADAQMYKEKSYRKACSEINSAEFQI